MIGAMVGLAVALVGGCILFVGSAIDHPSSAKATLAVGALVFALGWIILARSMAL